MIGKYNIEGELFCFFVATILTAFGASMLLCCTDKMNVLIGIAMVLLITLYAFFVLDTVVNIADKILK